MLLRTSFVCLAASLAATATAAALDKRLACTTTVVKAHTVSQEWYTDVDVMYGSSTVTIYATDAPASTPSSAVDQNQARDAAPAITPAPEVLEARRAAASALASAAASAENLRVLAARSPDDGTAAAAETSADIADTACAATATRTSTVTTVTYSTTFTFSHEARVTETAAACAAHNRYNGTVSYNTKQSGFPVGQPRGELFSKIKSAEACCNQCFQGSCMWYIFDNIDQDGSWVHGCKVYWADGACPNGWHNTEGIRNEVDAGSGRGITGLGSCLVEVNYFQAG